MIAIVCADQRWGIGWQNRQLVSIPSSQRRMRERVGGQVVILGRRTLDALPYGELSRDTTVLALSRDPGFRRRKVTVFSGEKSLLRQLEEYRGREVYVAGGESVYRMLLPYCDTALVTRVDMTYQADAFFPDLDKSPEWELTEEGEEQTCFDIEFRFQTYRRSPRGV